MGTLSIPLGNSKYVATVDEEDADLASLRWYASIMPCGVYVIGQDSKSGKTIYLHREVMRAPKGMDVDHINRNPLDNRRSNLRVCTRSQNLARSRPHGSSGYKGVWQGRTGKWIVDVYENGKRRRIHGFTSPEDAAREYDRVAREIHGEFAWLNFPDEKDETP